VPAEFPTAESMVAGAFGLLIGSFLNVCIYRLPRDLSVVRPRSCCPGCGKMVRSWDNIPVLSYIILRGRCRDCGERISVRYPFVEAACGLIFAWFVAREGVTGLALRDCVLCALLLALFFTDLETRLLPEILTFGGIVAGVAFSLFVPVRDGIFEALTGVSGTGASVADSLLGALIPAALLWCLGWLHGKVRKVEGLGFGDVVMLAEVGAFLGLRATVLTLTLAGVSGSVIGTGYILLKKEDLRKYELPLGSFLGGAGIIVTAFGGPIMEWYGRLF